MAIGNLDLPADQLALVREILMKHVPHAKVWAFGSRVQGTAKKFNDLPILVNFIDLHATRKPLKRIVEKQRVAMA
jgi:predicted nucleotidyltransferase